MSAEYRRDPEQYDRLRQDSQRRHAQAQRASLDTATRYGYQWTGPELEIVCRDDLTAAEMAALLGRTVAAVSTKRKRIHQAEPAPSWLAGKRSRLH
jgi:uncharacterized protein YfaS (alpha-2-macroglobulin family)